MKRQFVFASLMSALFAPLPAAAADQPPTVSVKLLSAELAGQAVAAAVRECSGRGYQVAAALVSRDGNLLAFLRDPLAGPHTVEVSRGKAYASASLRVSTAELDAMSDAEGLRFADGVIVLRGGIPIDIGGIFYGGIGVIRSYPGGRRGMCQGRYRGHLRHLGIRRVRLA